MRAAGTGLIALGTLVVAIGGAAARLSTPAALYLTELAGICLIFAGFSLTNTAFTPHKLSRRQLRQRRQRIAAIGVGFFAMLLAGSIAILPVLPWTMGIVRDAKQVYIPSVPAENRGAYLVTEQGVMQLYTWSVAPPEFPRDAPTLESTAIHSIAIVQKQFSEPEQYQLYNLSTNQLIAWQAVQKAGMKLVLVPDPLGAGQYLLTVPKDSMFGGKTNHYFRLQ